MKVENYRQPKSSFLSLEKDLSILIDLLFKNQRLQKLLFYTSRDALDKPKLNDEQLESLLEKNIKLVPKLYVDGSVLQYIIITFDNFIPNATNPQFRDNIISFDIICHFDQWQLKDFELRPYRIAAEIDSMINEQHLSGIGKLHFLGANQMILTDEFAGISLLYRAVHGEDDKKFAPNPKEDESLVENFNEIFNKHKSNLGLTDDES